MRHLLCPILIILGTFFHAAAQSLLEQPGINYQGIIFDPTGKALANLPLNIKIGFSSKGDTAQVFYTETHQASTNESGVFMLVLGKGKGIEGRIMDIPWASNTIYIDVSIQSTNNIPYSAFHSTPINAVPYAHYAAKSAKILQTDSSLLEKNQSIRWNTRGNDENTADVHFVGTRDSSDLVFKTNMKTNAVITKKGQLKIFGRTSGSDDDPTIYPLYVHGSNQGIFIKVNGERDNDNNFVTFKDGKNEALGAIEGQTKAEIVLDFEYIFKNFFLAKDLIVTGVEGVGTLKEASGLAAAGSSATASFFFSFAAPGFYVASAAVYLRAAALGVALFSLGYEAGKWNAQTLAEAGVDYSSGSADYAEYLERGPGEKKMQSGQIVGVKGGKISLNTSGAEQVLVISTAPIVLGNAPQPERKDDYEKVAFLGQVDVLVAGQVNIGDYILASGNNDGIGVALAPALLQTMDYRRVVGIAWEEAPNRALNRVRVGVGLNKNDLAAKVDEAEQKLNNILAYLEGKGPLRPDQPRATNESTVDQQQLPQSQFTSMSHEEFDRFVDESAPILSNYYKGQSDKLLEQGIKIPEAYEPFFKDPANTLKKLHRDPKYKEKWGVFEQILRSIH